METNAPKPAPAAPAVEPVTPQTKPDPISAPSQKAAPLATDVPPDISQPADYRLVIEKDPVSGAFIYKSIDRFTGEVVNQFPREELAKLGESATYRAGTVLTAKI